MAMAVCHAQSDPVKGLVGLKNMLVDARQDVSDFQLDLEDEISKRSKESPKKGFGKGSKAK